MNEAPPILQVVVVNFRTASLTLDCLKSVETQSVALADTVRIVVEVIDNASGDGSLEAIRAWADAHRSDLFSIHITAADHNLGFSRANNAGMQSTVASGGKLADFYLLLNSDTVVHPGCFEACLAVMAQSSDIGVMSCRLVEADGATQVNARRFPTPLRAAAAALGLPWRLPELFRWAHPDDPTWDRNTVARDVDWVGGAFMLIRHKVLDQAGMLDEAFFFYGEDLEFCHRVRRSGFRIRYDPTGITTHLGGGSSDVTRLPDAQKQRHRWGARYLVQWKLYGLWAVELLWVLDCFVWQARYAKKRWLDRDRVGAKQARAVRTLIRRLPQRGYDTRPSQVMRWAFVLPGLNLVNRGAETAFKALASALAARADCTATLIGAGPPDAGDRHAHSVAYIQAPLRDDQRREAQQGKRRLPTLRSAEAREDLAFARALMKVYQPQQFDLTVTCNYPWSNWLLRWRRGKSSQPRPAHLFITQNGDWPATSNDREFRFFDCDGLVCTNPLYYERNRDQWNATLIPNGFWPEHFSPLPPDQRPERARFDLPLDRPVVLIVSALQAHKRVLEGIEAAAAVDGIFLFVAGDGPLLDQVRAKGESLMPGRFAQGQVPHEAMGDLYRCADALLHPCLDEPSAHVYIEALASGLPVVTHDWQVTRWTFDDLAILVDATQIEAMSQGLRDALASDLKHRIHEAYDQTCARFAWPVLAEQLAAFGRSVGFGVPHDVLGPQTHDQLPTHEGP